MKKVLLLVFLAVSLVIVFAVSSYAGNYKPYHLKKYSLTVKIPETTNVSEFYNGADEVLFSARLDDKTLDYGGSLQIWNIGDLEDFLEKSKSTSSFNYLSYGRQKIRVKSFDGYRVDWTAKFRNGLTFTGKHYYLKKAGSDQVLNIMFLVQKNQFPEELERIAEKVVSSVEWK